VEESCIGKLQGRWSAAAYVTGIIFLDRGVIQMDITNKDVALATTKQYVEEARTFLHRIAKHLEENEMPGQAGNCTIHALKLQQAGEALAYLERIIQ
jgi:hypothetical protein